MSTQRYLMLYPIPHQLAVLASTLQGVQHIQKTACLLVPCKMFVDYAKGSLPAIPSTADWALHKVLTEYHGSVTNTTRLTLKVATAATRAKHQERRHHYLINRDLLELAVVQALFRLLWRCLSVPIVFACKCLIKCGCSMAQRLSKTWQNVTGKSSTKIYR